MKLTGISLVTDTISKKLIYKALIWYDTDITNIGDISRYFRHIDPPLLYT